MKTKAPSEQEKSEAEMYQWYVCQCYGCLNVITHDHEQLDSAIDLLPHTLALWCCTVQAKTGLNILILLGSPIPKLNSTIEILQ
jgi:hypothetical protein